MCQRTIICPVTDTQPYDMSGLFNENDDIRVNYVKPLTSVRNGIMTI